jgi:hypothetical protein
MVPLEQETNIEVLRQYSILATREVEKLKLALRKIEELTTPELQEWLGRDLKDQLSRLQKKFYGFGRESLAGGEDRPISRPQVQLKLHGKRGHEESKKEGNQQDQSEKSGSLIKAVEYEMSPLDLARESALRQIQRGGEGAWSKMKNFFQESVEITVTERVYTKVVHRQAKYRLKDEYNTSGKEVIITAPGPVKLKPGCQYSVDFALSVVSDKYEYHLPLERQRRKMEAQGLDVDVKTLYSLCQSVSDHMEEVVSGIREDILGDFCAAHLDESPWLIISEKKRGQMWTLSNRLGSYFRFEPTRSGAIAEEMLKGYSGAVLTDALPAYNRLRENPAIRRGLCWAHVRREFFERMDSFPVAEQMVRMIDELFKIEGDANTFEELRHLRAAKSRQVVMRMQDWMLKESQNYLPGDGIISAIKYCSNHWTDLTNFLKDLSLPLSNNDAERALRHVVMGRKNFNGSKTINGADVAATLYTIIETAKKSSLQPTEYMKYVITERWHGRKPKTPHALAVERFGPNKSTIFPHKDDWEIKACQ